MGKSACTRRCKSQDLEAMGERPLVAPLSAILDVVMDWMVVERDRLKGGEMRVGHRAARDTKALADRQILEVARFAKAVLLAVEALDVHAEPRLRACRPILSTQPSKIDRVGVRRVKHAGA